MSPHLRSVKRLLQRKGSDNYSLLSSSTSCNSNDPDDITTNIITTNFRSLRSSYEQSEIDGITIKFNDVKLIVDPTDLIVSTSDKVTDGLNTFTVKSVLPVYEANTVVMYYIQLRR